MSVFLNNGSFWRIAIIRLIDLRDRGAHKRSVRAAELKSGVFRASSRCEDMFGLAVVVTMAPCLWAKSGLSSAADEQTMNLKTF